MRKTLLVAGAALLLAAGPAMAQQKSVKIGFVSTFSGPVAAIGNDMRNSFELALDHMGRKMGGLPVEVIYEDDGFKPEVGKQKTEKLIESDKVDFISGYIWSNVLLASHQAGGRFKNLPDHRQCGSLADRRRTVLALCVLDLMAERPDAAGDGSVHELEGHKVGVPDRPELCRRQGHAGGRRLHLQGQGRGQGADHLAGAARLLRRAGQGESRQSGLHLRVLSGQGRRAVPGAICAGGSEGQDPAVHRLHHRRTVAAVAEGPRARRAGRAGMGQRSAQRGQQEIRRRLHQEISRPQSRRSTVRSPTMPPILSPRRWPRPRAT